jgi:mono/diheme cytochrome c family protein
MFTTIKSGVCVALIGLAASAVAAGPASPRVYGFGTPATPEELGQFVSPLPDGRGMPAGSGTVAQGKALFATQCAACHGAQLEGGIGDRLVGGRGTLVNADPTKAPIKTVESYWPYSTTLFDYIKRAMPLYQPGSLSNDDVYSLAAYILAEGKIVPADATLDQSSLPKVQMPNRDGFIPDSRPDKYLPVSRTPHSP